VTLPGKNKLSIDIVAAEYGFLQQNAGYRTKYTFTAPSYHRHFWHEKYSSDAYPAIDAAALNKLRLNPAIRFIPVRCLGCRLLNAFHWSADLPDRFRQQRELNAGN